MPLADIGGQKIYYEDTGGAGPAVVLSHGFAMNRGMFDQQVDVLRGAFRCITWDERAHGQTIDDGRPFSYWDSAADVLGLLDHLGLESAAFVGMSQGGFLALRAAMRAPDRVRALAIISSRAGVDAQEVLDGFAGLRAEWLANGPANVRDFLADMLVGDPAYYPPLFAKWDAWDRDDVARAIDALTGRDDVSEAVLSIDTPALVFHGTADKAIAPEHGEDLARRLDATFVPVSGAGHTANLTHAAAVNPPLAAFLHANA